MEAIWGSNGKSVHCNPMENVKAVQWNRFFGAQCANKQTKSP